MPLYEGIGLGTEKQPVVIDIGTAYTKFGFAGETGPRCIISTEVMCQESGRIKKIFKYSNEEELYKLLVDFIHNLYFRHLLVSPKDRRVIIVESLLCPSVFRDTLAKVLFRHFEVSSVLFVPSHLVALCTLGVSTALVLDVGYQEAVLIPVYEGVPVLHAWQAQPLASHAVESNLRKRLNGDDNGALSVMSSSCRISDSTVEDIKVRTCFVTSFERAHKITTGQPDPPPPSVSYQADGSNTVDVPGSARELAYEVLFEQDGDEMSVSTMVLDAILKCPVDMRKELAENILVMGGTSMATGFKARLMSELKHLVSSPKYSKQLAIKVFKMHKPPAKENYVAWLGVQASEKLMAMGLQLLGLLHLPALYEEKLMAMGLQLLGLPIRTHPHMKMTTQFFTIVYDGAQTLFFAFSPILCGMPLKCSIFGGTDVIVTRSLTKEAYLKENRIPDWANLMFNCRDEEDSKTLNL